MQIQAPYILMTWHRQENTQSRERMEQILSFLSEIKCQIICPMHPRTRECLKKFGLGERAAGIPNFTVTEPVGYFEMVKLMNGSRLILTDSGGLSKEAYFAGVECLFMLDAVIWRDLFADGWIKNIDFDDVESVAKALKVCDRQEPDEGRSRKNYYGDGHTAERIVDLLEKEQLI